MGNLDDQGNLWLYTFVASPPLADGTALYAEQEDLWCYSDLMLGS